jgi:hypothetical protein
MRSILTFAGVPRHKGQTFGSMKSGRKEFKNKNRFLQKRAIELS